MDRQVEGTTSRERSLRMAWELFLRSGYDGVSMQQIADAAQMTAGSPYYFAGKEDLVAQVFKRHMNRLHAGVARLVGERG